MQIVSVNTRHIPFILQMYRDIFQRDINENIYNYFYLNNAGDYCSYVALSDEGAVMGHHAVIQSMYYLASAGRSVTVGLCSGAMVYPSYSGVYYQMLKQNVSSFSGDILIAFPNENSKGFFQRFFNFNVRGSTYWTIEPSKKLGLALRTVDNSYKRTSDFVSWRLFEHPYNVYQKISDNSAEMYYKEFGGEAIDLLYTSNYGDFFLSTVTSFLEKGLSVNLLSTHYPYFEALGFTPVVSKGFAIRYFTESLPKFDCQMIDSDVY